MPDESWKRWEREVAVALGGTRTGPIGEALPDVAGIPLAMECKYLQRLGLRSEFVKQAKRNARGLPWALAIKEKGGKYKVVMVDLDFFVKLWNAYRKDLDAS